MFYQDSNLDKQDQNLLCYHYTIEQCNFKTKHPKEVVLPGFEPGQTGPESVVLPLHHRTMSYVVLTTTFSFAVQRYAFLRNCQIKIDFFFIFSSTKEILYRHSNCNQTSFQGNRFILTRKIYLILIYFISFHVGGTIVSHLWNDRTTQVKRSLHKGETV